MVFGSRPFWFFGNINSLVAQMIGFVEELPVEWKPEWERLRRSDEHKRDDIPGMDLQFVGQYKLGRLTSKLRYILGRYSRTIQTGGEIREGGP
jgi:hypothetical protein